MLIAPRVEEKEDWKRTSLRSPAVARSVTSLLMEEVNVVSQELVDKRKLKTEKHPSPYHIAWVNDESIPVHSRCLDHRKARR